MTRIAKTSGINPRIPDFERVLIFGQKDARWVYWFDEELLLLFSGFDQVTSFPNYGESTARLLSKGKTIIRDDK